MKKVVVISILGIFACALLGSFLFWQDFVNRSVGTASTEVVFEVKPKMSFRAIAKELYAAHLISNPELLVLYSRLKGSAGQAKVGEYALNQGMKPSEILSVLNSGKSIEYQVTISEGLSMYEIADIFAQAKLCPSDVFLKTVTDKELVKSLIGEDVDSLEGFLFPSTYSFTKYTDYKELIRKMVANFQENYKEALSQAKIKGWNRKQIVTLASIIEKETGAPSERPLVSSVFHNRLKKGMMLQTDPTIIYGKARETGKIEINITRADLTRFTPYNTYVIKGLPPGPISNPGKAALQAAVDPAQSEFLFFVSHNDGTHQFSADLVSHNAAVKKFQLDPKAREGKSWRDLNKTLQKEETQAR
jgi:UPF0755 protein